MIHDPAASPFQGLVVRSEGDVPPPSPPGRGVGGEVYARGPGMTDRARRLRNDMTDAERRMWSLLRGDRLGVRFRRQLVIDRRYIADFCAPQIALIVEVDGGQHAGNADDERRTAYLAARGYRVMRFWNTDVLLATEGVAQAVWDAVQAGLAARTSPLSPLRNGEGKRSALMAGHGLDGTLMA